MFLRFGQVSLAKCITHFDHSRVYVQFCIWGSLKRLGFGYLVLQRCPFLWHIFPILTGFNGWSLQQKQILSILLEYFLKTFSHLYIRLQNSGAFSNFSKIHIFKRLAIILHNNFFIHQKYFVHLRERWNLRNS